MRRRQQGVVVLLVLMLLVTAGSYALLRSLNEAVQRNRDTQAGTAASLAAAERALLGYATRFPDDPTIESHTTGPGLLPCPDTSADSGPGQADPPCAQSSSTETGLFPWRTLDLAEPRDSDGAPLWYAVADAFRNNPAGTVNPSTLAGLRLDDCAAGARQIAALLIAPGAALGTQNRSTASAAARYDAANYLEGQNASRGDGCFESTRGATANDVVRVIDRAQLLAAVQRRVLADVGRALERYYEDPDGDDVAGVDADCTTASLPDDCDNAMPWLSPYDDPTTSAYLGVVGTRAGHLPLRIKDADFPAPFRAVWQFATTSSFLTTGSSPPDLACMRSTSAVCSVQPTGFASPAPIGGAVLGTGSAPYGDGSCRWLGGQGLRCETTITVTDPGGTGHSLSRAFVIEIHHLPRTIAPPSGTQPRLEDVLLANTVLGSNASILITATDTLIPPAAPKSELGLARILVSPGVSVDSFALTGVPFHLEVDDDDSIDPATRRSPGELPHWFVANDWQQFIALAYAAAYAPGDVAADCTAGVDCLRLERQLREEPANVLDDVRGVVLSGGAALATQTRPSADPAQVFEDENSTFDDRYTERATTPDFNDLVRRLMPDE